MAVRNRCVARGRAPIAGGQVWYKVPAGYNFILKFLGLYKASGTAAQASVYVIDSGGLFLVQLHAADLTSSPYQALSTWTVLNEGDELVASTFNGEINYWVAGAELTA